MFLLSTLLILTHLNVFCYAYSESIELVIVNYKTSSSQLWSKQQDLTEEVIRSVLTNHPDVEKNNISMTMATHRINSYKGISSSWIDCVNILRHSSPSFPAGSFDLSSYLTDARRYFNYTSIASKKYVLVFVDGDASSWINSIWEASQLKSLGVRIIAVARRTAVEDEQSVHEMASAPARENVIWLETDASGPPIASLIVAKIKKGLSTSRFIAFNGATIAGSETRNDYFSGVYTLFKSSLLHVQGLFVPCAEDIRCMVGYGIKTFGQEWLTVLKGISRGSPLVYVYGSLISPKEWKDYQNVFTISQLYPGNQTVITSKYNGTEIDVFVTDNGFNVRLSISPSAVLTTFKAGDRVYREDSIFSKQQYYMAANDVLQTFDSRNLTLESYTRTDCAAEINANLTDFCTKAAFPKDFGEYIQLKECINYCQFNTSEISIVDGDICKKLYCIPSLKQQSSIDFDAENSVEVVGDHLQLSPRHKIIKLQNVFEGDYCIQVRKSDNFKRSLSKNLFVRISCGDGHQNLTNAKEEITIMVDKFKGSPIVQLRIKPEDLSGLTAKSIKWNFTSGDDGTLSSHGLVATYIPNPTTSKTIISAYIYDGCRIHKINKTITIAGCLKPSNVKVFISNDFPSQIIYEGQSQLPDVDFSLITQNVDGNNDQFIFTRNWALKKLDNQGLLIEKSAAREFYLFKNATSVRTSQTISVTTNTSRSFQENPQAPNTITQSLTKQRFYQLQVIESEEELVETKRTTVVTVDEVTARVNYCKVTINNADNQLTMDELHPGGCKGNWELIHEAIDNQCIRKQNVTDSVQFSVSCGPSPIPVINTCSSISDLCASSTTNNGEFKRTITFDHNLNAFPGLFVDGRESYDPASRQLSYQWFLGSNQISSQSSTVVQLDTPGDNDLILMVDNTCEKVNTTFTLVGNCPLACLQQSLGISSTSMTIGPYNANNVTVQPQYTNSTCPFYSNYEWYLQKYDELPEVVLNYFGFWQQSAQSNSRLTFVPRLTGLYEIKFWLSNGCSESTQTTSMNVQCSANEFSAAGLLPIRIDHFPNVQQQLVVKVNFPQSPMEALWVINSTTIAGTNSTLTMNNIEYRFTLTLYLYNGCQLDSVSTQVYVYPTSPSPPSPAVAVSNNTNSPAVQSGRNDVVNVVSNKFGVFPTVVLVSNSPLLFSWTVIEAPELSIYAPVETVTIENDIDYSSSTSGNTTTAVNTTWITRTINRKYIVLKSSSCNSGKGICFRPDLPGRYRFNSTGGNDRVTINANCLSQKLANEGSVQINNVFSIQEPTRVQFELMNKHARDFGVVLANNQTIIQTLDFPLTRFTFFVADYYQPLILRLLVSDGCTHLLKNQTVDLGYPQQATLVDDFSLKDSTSFVGHDQLVDNQLASVFWYRSFDYEGLSLLLSTLVNPSLSSPTLVNMYKCQHPKVVKKLAVGSAADTSALSGGVIAGITIGVLVLVGIFAVLSMYIFRRRKRNAVDDAPALPQKNDTKMSDGNSELENEFEENASTSNENV